MERRKVEGVRIRIGGVVQGVGFRPFVYRAALKLGLTGHVTNEASGVIVEAYGAPEILSRFGEHLRDQPPPLAVIRSFEIRGIPGDPALAEFRIAPSRQGEAVEVDMARDTATCEDCLRELFSPGDRRHRHPFINCTNCGPRYTIIRGLPYDRERTSMAGFPMCAECRREYESAGDRRFHAQPVCCNRCGPALQLLDGAGKSLQVRDPLAACRDKLEEGAIVAVKGLGGFHLACRADSEEAVTRLRERKHREEKPFAVMVRDLEAVRRLADPSETEGRLLQGMERPIVILPAKSPAAGIAAAVAPRVTTLGIMLPYTPVQHLLFEGASYEALVMTSGNRSEEPIVVGNREALEKLGGIADAFLVHDRDILLRADDSIARVLAGQSVLLRRARGYVPDPLPAGCDVNGIVALGGILKSTVTLGKGAMCYTSQYLGAVDNPETLRNLEQVLEHLAGILEVRPESLVVDLHPDNPTRRIAERSGLPVASVQHHHAHAVACMAENGVEDDALCVVYDGTGYGEDGTVWGGEILRAGRSRYERVGRLGLVPMPGADAAVLNPGRMALAALSTRVGEAAREACPWLPEAEKHAVFELLRAGLHCPLTSSMGRLFDAAAATLDICRSRTYEGQPAIELEGCADRTERGEYEVRIHEEAGTLVLDGVAILVDAWHDVRKGTPVSRVSARFHNTVARMTALAVGRLAEASGLDTVCLSGGCFQNALLFEGVQRHLAATRLKVRVHRILPPNDECVSYGQAVIAATRRACGQVPG